MARVRTLLRVTGVLGAVIIAATLAGCGGGSSGGGGTPGPTDPPTISLARVELPAGFSFMGGTVTLKAVVVAPAGVSNVKAFVNGPAGASEITLGFLAGGYYSAGYTAPANTSKDGIDANYSVVFTATDTEGRKVSSAPVVFVVPAPPSPPPPPG